MILSRPTGSYKQAIPQTPDAAGSVVYTISSTDPPRTALNFNQIPTGVSKRTRIPRLPGETLRRENLGVLVYTQKDNRPSHVSVGNQMFYVGQIREFQPEDTLSEIGHVNTRIDMEHDKYRISGDNLNLESSQVESLGRNAEAAQAQVLLELEGLQKSKDNLDADIVSHQKALNEVNRVLAGVGAILEVDPTNEEVLAIKDKMAARKIEIENDLNETVSRRNEIPAAVRQKQDKLRALSLLVR